MITAAFRIPRALEIISISPSRRQFSRSSLQDRRDTLASPRYYPIFAPSIPSARLALCLPDYKQYYDKIAGFFVNTTKRSWKHNGL